MKIIESRRFVAGAGELRLFLVEEEEHRLPFRVRLKMRAGKNGVLSAFETEAEARTALDAHVIDAVASGWRQAPAQVRLVLGIPAAPGGVAAPAPPACAHEAIQAYLPKLAAGLRPRDPSVPTDTLALYDEAIQA